MAEAKDTDSAPDTGHTGSDSASPETPDELARELRELDALDEREDEDGSNDGRELVGVGAAGKARRSSGGASGTVARSTATGRGRKDRATPKQRTGEEREKRTGPIGFVKGSVSELKKVVYPTGAQLGNYFVVVLIFVMLVIAVVTGLDYGFGWVLLKVFT